MPQTAGQLSVGLDLRQAERDAASFFNRFARNRRLDINVGGNASFALGQIATAADDFDKSLAAANQRVLAFGLSVGLIYNVQRAFVAVFNATREVEKSLTDINVILNASSQTLAKFSNDLFKVASQTGQSFENAALAATEFARQGLGIEETLRRTRDALILVRLSGGDVAGTVDALTASINSFSKSALDSTIVINKLANVDAAFAVSANDLSEAIKRTGSTAQDAGVSIDQLVAAITAAREVTGRSGDVLGNSFKTIFQRVQRPAVLVQLEQLGIETENFRNGTESALDVLEQLGQKFEGLEQSGKAYVTQLAAGVFQANVFRALLSDLAGGELSRYSRALDISVKSTDQAIRRNEELNQTFDALLVTTGNTFKEFAAILGDVAIQPFARPLLKEINEFISGISDDVKNNGGQELGTQLGLGFIEGLGKFFTGPGGLALVTIFGKLFFEFLKFLPVALERVLVFNRSIGQGLNQQNQALVQTEALQNNITKGLGNRLSAQSKINQEVQRESSAKQIVATVQNGIISNLNKELIGHKQISAEIEKQNALKLTQNNLSKLNPIYALPQTQRTDVARFVAPQIPVPSGTQPPTPMTLEATRNIRNILESPPPEFNRRANRFIGINPQTGRKGFLSEAEGRRQGGLLPGEETLDDRGLNLLRQGAAREVAQQKLEAEKKLTALTREASSVLGGGRARRELTILAGQGNQGAIAAQNNAAAARQAGTQRLNSALLGTAIIAPIIESTVSRINFDRNTIQGRRGAATTNVLGQTLSGAATGALVGSQFGGPIGAGVGAAAGGLIFSIGGIIEAIRNWDNVLPDLERKLQSITDATTRTEEFFNQVIKLTEALQNSNLTSTDRDRLEGQLRVLLQSPNQKEAADAILETGGNLDLINALRNQFGDRGARQQGVANLERFIVENFTQNPENVSRRTVPFSTAPDLSGLGGGAFPRPGRTITNLTEGGRENIKLLFDQLAAEGLAEGFKNPELKQIVGNTFADAAATEEFRKNFASSIFRAIVLSGGNGERAGGIRSSLQSIPLDQIELVGKEFAKLLENLSSDEIEEYIEAQRRATETVESNMKSLGDEISQTVRQIKDFNIELLNSINTNRRSDLQRAAITDIRRQGELDRLSPLLNQSEINRNSSALNQERIIVQSQDRIRQIGASFIGNTGQFGINQLEKIEKELAGLENRDSEGNEAFVNSIKEFRAEFDQILREIAEGNFNPESIERLRGVRANVFAAQEDAGLNIETTRGLDDLFDSLIQLDQDLIGANQDLTNELELNNERLKQLNTIISKSTITGAFQSGDISGRRAAEELGKRRARLLENQRGNFDIGAGASEAFSSQFLFNVNDLYREILDGSVEVADTIKSSFKGAVNSIVTGAEDIEGAFRNLLLNISTAILEQTTSIGIDSLLGGITGLIQNKNSGGIIQKFSSGGVVNGGSGTKDDVPALLTDGEYVIKKAAVDKYGESFFNQLQNGASVSLANSFNFNDARRPTGGSFNIDPNLSSFALEDDNNPRNALRRQQETTLSNYLREFESYQLQRQQAMRAFSKQRRNILFGSYLSAATNIGGGYLSGLNSVPEGSVSVGPITNAPSSSSKFGEGFGGYGVNFDLQRNMGGMIKKYANGGYAFGGNDPRDNIPALLTGGEYVMRKEVVDQYGKSFFDNINQMKFANGGSVGGGNSNNYNNNMSNDMDILGEAIEKLNSLLDKRQNNNSINSSGGGITTSGGSDNFNTTINLYVSDKGQISSDTNMTSNSSKEGQEKRMRDLKELTKLIDSRVRQTIVEERKPNRLLDPNR